MNDFYSSVKKTDEDLVRLLVATRDNRHLNLLCARYYDKVFTTCLSWMKQPDLAADCTQEIFVRVHLKIDAFQFQSTFSTWLFAISRNYCADRIRYSKRHPDPLSLYDHYPDMETCDPFHEETIDWEQIAVQCMEKLKPEDEQLLRLKYLMNNKVEDMARQYDVTESAMKMRLKRARGRLEQVCQRQLVSLN
jgi:RNA polymerase sigma factor (sigma-70 family)